MAAIEKRESDKARRPAEAVFRPIVGSRAALEVADQLAFAVMSGVYRPGEFLPTIEELAEVMRVSRPTVGEAVHLLADGGVLEARRGSKGGICVVTTVVPPSLLKLSRQRRGRNLSEVVEARRPVEIALVRLAAVRATGEDFERLEASNELLVAAGDDKTAWAQAHNLFHAVIGHAAQNGLLAYVQHELLEELAILLDGYDDRYSDPDRTIREHRDTLAALRPRDPDLAEAAMDEHLRELEELAPLYDADIQASEKVRRSPPSRRRRPNTSSKP